MTNILPTEVISEDDSSSSREDGLRNNATQILVNLILVNYLLNGDEDILEKITNFWNTNQNEEMRQNIEKRGSLLRDYHDMERGEVSSEAC